MPSVYRAITYLLHKRSLFCDSIVKNYLQFLPDKIYLSLRYRCLMGKWINWKSPKTFTEKLQWLKVNDVKPEYTQQVDKHAVKQYVIDKIGEQYIIPTYGVWDNAEDIDWETLPQQFVLKTTHGGGGGGVVICTDKNNLDKEATIKKLSESMKRSAGTFYREHQYENVPRKIIAEKYIGEVNNKDLLDYKFYCFSGEVKYVLVVQGRNSKQKLFDYFDVHWNHLPVYDEGTINAPIPPSKPLKLHEMVAIAQKLSEGKRHVRIDLYYTHGNIYFGEITFYDGSGFCKYVPKIYDYHFGNLLNINEDVK